MPPRQSRNSQAALGWNIDTGSLQDALAGQSSTGRLWQPRESAASIVSLESAGGTNSAGGTSAGGTSGGGDGLSISASVSQASSLSLSGERISHAGTSSSHDRLDSLLSSDNDNDIPRVVAQSSRRSTARTRARQSHTARNRGIPRTAQTSSDYVPPTTRRTRARTNTAGGNDGLDAPQASQPSTYTPSGGSDEVNAHPTSQPSTSATQIQHTPHLPTNDSNNRRPSSSRRTRATRGGGAAERARERARQLAHAASDVQELQEEAEDDEDMDDAIHIPARSTRARTTTARPVPTAVATARRAASALSRGRSRTTTTTTTTRRDSSSFELHPSASGADEDDELGIGQGSSSVTRYRQVRNTARNRARNTARNTSSEVDDELQDNSRQVSGQAEEDEDIEGNDDNDEQHYLASSSDESSLPGGMPGHSLTQAEADSLADASPEEVEARALELLGWSDIGKDVQLQTFNPDRWRNIGVAHTTPGTAEYDEVKTIQAALLQAVNDLESTDWMYEEPTPFLSHISTKGASYGSSNLATTAESWADDAWNPYSVLETVAPAFEGSFPAPGRVQRALGLIDRHGRPTPRAQEGRAANPYGRLADINFVGFGRRSMPFAMVSNATARNATPARVNASHAVITV
ncbi:hypothetical protein EMMF5_003138 [Cystobasidiomycetes sp. EMM_F5]